MFTLLTKFTVLTMELSRREQKRLETEFEIKEVARQQMAEVGAASLSLRAIARKMGMSAPALYRYFPNRDALVTTLIIEAFTSLGDAMLRAEEDIDSDDFHGRFRAVAQAFRSWAMTHPQDFSLIYGTPIPGYHAPREQTVEPAGRVMLIMGMALARALEAEQLPIPEPYVNLTPTMQAVVDDIADYLPPDISTNGVVLTMSVWARLYGVIWGELYDHFIPGLYETGALYEVEVNALCSMLGLTVRS